MAGGPGFHHSTCTLCSLAAHSTFSCSPRMSQQPRALAGTDARPAMPDEQSVLPRWSTDHVVKAMTHHVSSCEVRDVSEGRCHQVAGLEL